MSRFVSHPAGAELGGVGETADTTKENQCAHTGAGEEPPSVAYESDAVRRLETIRGHGWRRAACKAAPSRPTGRVCLFERELTKRGVRNAGRARRQSEFRTLPTRRIGMGRSCGRYRQPLPEAGEKRQPLSRQKDIKTKRQPLPEAGETNVCRRHAGEHKQRGQTRLPLLNLLAFC